MKFEIQTAEHQDVFINYPQLMGAFVTEKRDDKFFVTINSPQDIINLIQMIGAPVMVDEDETLTIVDGWL